MPTDVVPKPGTAWPDAQLAQVLKLAPVGPVLLYEPDRGGESFHIAPRLLMNGADVPPPGSSCRGAG